MSADAPARNTEIAQDDPAPSDMEQSASAEPEVKAEDVTNRLIEQLNRAAAQGLVELAETSEEEPEVPDLQADIPETEPEQYLQPIEADIENLEAMVDRFARALDDEGISGSVTVNIPETFPVIPKPGQLPEVPEPSPEIAENEHCIDPDILDVRAWSDDRPAAIQISDLRGKVFG